MTEQTFNQALAQGNVNAVQPQAPLPQEKLKPFSEDDYQAVIERIRRPRRHLTTAPTFTPKSFVDSIQFYDDGTNRRTYFYINGTWRYVALT